MRIVAEADGFLYKMVRRLVGALAAAGEGKLSTREIESLLKSGARTARDPDRARAGAVPAAGPLPLSLEFGCHSERCGAASRAQSFMHFDKPTYSVRKTKKTNIPEGLYTKDPVTGEILFNKEIEDNQMVVPKSGHHFPIGASERLAKLLDPGSFVELHENVRYDDPLKFVDSQPYPDRIKRNQKSSGLPEAVICGTGSIHAIPVAVAVMDFRFCGGSMGSAAGEKITRTIEDALEKKIPCIIVSASGGARMQEGIYSLMQMAKTSAALGRLAPRGAALHLGPDAPDDGRRDRELRHARGRDPRGARRAHRLRRRKGHQGHHQADAARRLPDGRIPPEARPHRPDRQPHRDARQAKGHPFRPFPEEGAGRRERLSGSGP